MKYFKVTVSEENEDIYYIETDKGFHVIEIVVGNKVNDGYVLLDGVKQKYYLDPITWIVQETVSTFKVDHKKVRAIRRPQWKPGYNCEKSDLIVDGVSVKVNRLSVAAKNVIYQNLAAKTIILFSGALSLSLEWFNHPYFILWYIIFILPFAFHWITMVYVYKIFYALEKWKSEL